MTDIKLLVDSVRTLSAEDVKEVASALYDICAKGTPKDYWAEQAFHKHIEEHQCDKRGGFGHCDEAMRLYSLQWLESQGPWMAIG